MHTTREIVLDRPCVEDPSDFIAESNFGHDLDMEIVCRILDELDVPERRCSIRLGVARFRLDDWQVMVYRKGRIDVRRVTDVDNAADAMSRVESIVSLAFQD
jgi:ArsR family metal-binding transcriptional regulator